MSDMVVQYLKNQQVFFVLKWASLVAPMVKDLLQCRTPGFNPWVGKIPWRRAWQLTPVFLPGESHGHRSPAAYSPQGHKESDMTQKTQHTQRESSLQMDILVLILEGCSPVSTSDHFTFLWALDNFSHMEKPQVVPIS